MCAELARDGCAEFGEEFRFQTVQGSLATNELAIFMEGAAGPRTEDPEENGGNNTVADVKADLDGFM